MSVTQINPFGLNVTNANLTNNLEEYGMATIDYVNSAVGYNYVTYKSYGALSGTYNNGLTHDGVGATFTITSPVVDGATLVVDDTVLLVDQISTPWANGIYKFEGINVLKRVYGGTSSIGLDAACGKSIFILSGTQWRQSLWTQTNVLINMNDSLHNPPGNWTTAGFISYVQISAGGGGGAYYPGSNMLLSGNTFSLNPTLSGISGISMSGPIDMATSGPIRNLPAPTQSSDAANKLYVDNKVNVQAGNGISLTGKVLSTNVTGSNGISASYASGVLQLSGNYVAGANITISANNIAMVSALTGISQLTMTGLINMGGYKINSVADPTSPQDAATKAYVDTKADSYLPTAGGTMTGQLKTITPVETTDATNKAYVDSRDASRLLASTTYANTKLALAGGTMSGLIDMGGYKINSVANPTSPQDAATKAYVDTNDATNLVAANAYANGKLSLAGGTMTGKITGIQTPTAAGDAVPKSYADMLTSGVSFMPAVACYAQDDMFGPFSASADNQTIMLKLIDGNKIDNYTVQIGDRVLVNFVSNDFQSFRGNNGVYQVISFSTDGASMTRSVDLDGSPLSEFKQGGLFYVTNGTVYGGSLFVQTSPPPTVLGTSPIIYSQYAAAKNIAAGANIVITGNQIAVNPSLTGITSITGLSTPVANADAANKAYVNAQDAITLTAANDALMAHRIQNNAQIVAVNGYAEATRADVELRLPFTGGTMSGAINMGGQALTNISSLSIHTPGSDNDKIIFGKRPGTSYIIFLPGTPPSANTYLKYDGTDYAWSAAGSALTAFAGATAMNSGTEGLVPAPQPGQQDYVLTGDGSWQPASAAVTPITNIQYFMATTSATLLALPASTTYLTFGLGSYYFGSNVSQIIPDTSVYKLNSGYTYKISFTCDVYSGLTAAGVFAIAQSTTSTLPASISNFTTQTLGSSYNTANSAASYYKPECDGYITTASDMYVGVVYTGPGNGANFANRLLTIEIIDVTATEREYFIATNSATLVALASNAYLTFGLGSYYTKYITFGSNVSQITSSVYKLNSGYSYKISFTCDVYSGLAAIGAFYIVRNNTSTLPPSITNLISQTLGNLYNSTSNAAANFKPVVYGYITTTEDTYIGIRYSGSGNGANIANGLLTIEVVSNNNAITASTTNDLVGYIRAPQADDQTKYLQGNGTWSAVSGSGAVAAQYYYASLTSNPAANTNMVFNTNIVSAGTNVISTNGSTFTLAVGYTYKIFVNVTYNNLSQTNAVTTLTIYNNSTVIATGRGFIFTGGCAAPFVASAFITPTVTANISVRADYAMVTTPGFITIEVVSNNNAITAFTGATSVANGTVGYIPAPQMGTQNSYLRGDGTWQQANNAPTAAQYLFASSAPDQVIGVQPYKVLFPLIISSSGGIVATSSSIFTLPTGGTYRLSGCLTDITNSHTYRFYANGLAIGESAQNTNSTMRGCIAIAYLTTTVATQVSLVVFLGPGGTINGNTSAEGRGPWIEILQISNNNTITAFTGATSVADGTVGYIPAPQMGTQNSYLRGDGTWQQANNAPTAAEYLFAYVAGGSQVTSGNFNTPTYLLFPSTNTLRVGGAATQSLTDTTKFTILPGYSYKITSAVSQAYSGNNEIAYMQIHVNNVGQGAQGKGVPVHNTDMHITDFTAVCYVTPTASSTVQVGYGANAATRITSAWVTIEVVSNNNTITAFTGATSVANGTVGYIPAPQPGDQTKFLSGSGNWLPISNYFSAVTLSGQNAVPFINIPSSATEITVIFRGVSITQATADFVVQLGYGATPTYATAGYIGIASDSSTSNNNLVTSHATGFGIWSNNAVTSFTGVMKIILLDPLLNTWIATLTGAIVQPTLTGTEISSSYIPLTGPLTSLRVMASAGTAGVTFSGGSINVKYTI